uniref:CASP-like protein 5A2 n=1 Tax=Pteridium aquilinum subsp. aquilinum TaxID=104588 RepID=CSPL1_PTEAA|nr:RecName: Full=CASP-like protein 5A2; Short=PaCASPL5A2 [Pteridium aquilinum subsp. aquilinum]
MDGSAHLRDPPGPAVLRWRLEDMHIIPGTSGSLALRICQFSAAIVSFSVMISAANFSSVTAFCFLVAAMVLQCMWSLSVATIEGYAMLVGRSLRDSPLLSLFAVGDWVTAVITFAGACASAGIAVLVGRDIHRGCDVNFCGRYAAAAGMAFLSWLLISTSFLFTFWLLATR